MTAAERLDEITAHIALAHREVDALCAGKRWTMYVPARPGVDSDLVLSEGLSDGEQSAAALILGVFLWLTRDPKDPS